MKMNDGVIDESHPAYQEFFRCFAEGASLQDIYGESDEGFGVRHRPARTDPESLRRLRAACRHQFARIFGHSRNLATPIRDLIGLSQKRVLDFGSGTGALAVAVALKGASVIASDPNEVSLEACQWRARYFGLDDDRVSTVALDVKPGLPFRDAEFDVVTCNSVIEFLPRERDKYLREMIRVLKPGGHIVLSTENGLYPMDRYSRKLFTVFRREEMRRANLPYGTHYFEIRNWLKASGRQFHDLSIDNAFNSIDNVVATRRETAPGLAVELLARANRLFKGACRIVHVPSQIFFPYTTFIFQVH